MRAEIVEVDPRLDEERADIGGVLQPQAGRHGVAVPVRPGDPVHHAGDVAEQEFAAVVGIDIAGAELGVGLQRPERPAPVDPGVELRHAQQVIAGHVRVADIGGGEADPGAQGVALGADAFQPGDHADAEQVVTGRQALVLLLVQHDLLGPGAGGARLLLAERPLAGGHALGLGGPRQGAEDVAGMVRQHLVDGAVQAGLVGLGQEGVLDARVDVEIVVDGVVAGGLGAVHARLFGRAAAHVEGDDAGGGIGVKGGDEQIGGRAGEA